MEKFVNLTAPVYDNVTAIRISHKFDKREGGYLVEAEPITRHDGGLFSKCFCRKYYEHDGDGIALRVAAGRRSKKKETELDNYIAENAYTIAERYVQDIKRKLNITNSAEIIKED